MPENCMSCIRNGLHNFFNNRQVNIFVTTIMIMFSTFVIFISITRRSFLSPYETQNFTREIIFPDTNVVEEMTNTVLSLMLLLFAALFFGKIAEYAKLPPLVGSLICGIIVRNISCIDNFLIIVPAWDFTMRRLAMCNMIIRWAINIDVPYLQSNLAQIIFFGIFSSLLEVVSIASVAYFLLHYTFPVAVLAGVQLGTASPVVSVPIVMKLKQKGCSIEKRMQSIIPAACCFDNLMCVSVFCLTIGLTYSQEGSLAYTLHFCGQIFASTLAACALGWLVCWFPRSNEDHTQLARILLIAVISVAAIFFMAGVDEAYCGIIGTLVFVCFATTRWRIDNPQKAVPIERAFNSTWNLLFCPILFALFGRRLYFESLPTWEPLWHALTFFGIGLVARLIGGLISTSCGEFRFKEQLLLTLAMMPKATVQAALAPGLTRLLTIKPELDDEIRRLAQIAILMILFNSPIVDYLLTFLGPKLLSNSNTGNIVIVTTPSDADDNASVTTYNRAEKIDDDANSMVTFKQFRSLYASQYDHPFNQKPYAIDRY